MHVLSTGAPGFVGAALAGDVRADASLVELTQQSLQAGAGQADFTWEKRAEWSGLPPAMDMHPSPRSIFPIDFA